MNQPYKTTGHTPDGRAVEQQHDPQQQIPTYLVRQQPTAWQSIPTFVRFAVWLWAIGTVLALVAGVIGALSVVSTGAVLLGGL